MATTDVLGQLIDGITAQRVFGEPVEREGLTVIPAAVLYAGGGTGSTGQPGRPSPADGEGGGLGVVARPVGAYVIKNGEVSWQPALDLRWVIAGGQLVAAVALVSFALAFRRRQR
jgi:uncharacterized spore protein YtfJ